MSSIPDAVNGLFQLLPSVKKVINLVDRGLDIYNPVLARHAAPSAQERDLKIFYSRNLFFLNSFLNELLSIPRIRSSFSILENKSRLADILLTSGLSNRTI